jgi:hypothetical protein
MNSAVVARQHIVSDDGARLVLFARGREMASWALPVVGPPDLEFIDALAHWELAARRAGYRLQVQSAGPDLLELLELVGLRDALVASEADALQVRGQTERLEQPGVEEVVQPDDPAV